MQATIVGGHCHQVGVQNIPEGACLVRWWLREQVPAHAPAAAARLVALWLG